MRRRALLEDFFFQREFAIFRAVPLPEPVSARLGSPLPDWVTWVIAVPIATWLTLALLEPFGYPEFEATPTYLALLTFNLPAVCLAFAVIMCLGIPMALIGFVLLKAGLPFNFQPLFEPIAYLTLGSASIFFWTWLVDLLFSFLRR